LLRKFLDIISKFVQVDPLSDKEAALLAKLNPDRIYLENVRTLLNVSPQTARRICETAVRQGLFTRKIGVLCPDKNIGATAQTEDQLPATVHCTIEREGQFEEEDIPTEQLDKITFYQLNDDTASLIYG